MKETLRFLQGAIGNSGSALILQHVVIANGCAMAFNGNFAMCCKLESPLAIAVKGKEFAKAVIHCDKEPAIELTKAGRLKVSSGSFKAFIDTMPLEGFPDIAPEGDSFELTADLLDVFKTLLPFVADNENHKWASGVIIRDGYAYATNNVILACYTVPIGVPFNTVIPIATIEELVKLDLPITRLQISARTVTFHFDDARWLRSNLIDSPIPDFYPIFAKCSFDASDMVEVQADLPERLARLKPFLNVKTGVLIFRKNGVFTEQGEQGASDSEYGFPLSVFRFDAIMKVLKHATHWQLANYPAPCPFIGNNISGVIIGQKVSGDA